jgi:hypothetical protein
VGSKLADDGLDVVPGSGSRDEQDLRHPNRASTVNEKAEDVELALGELAAPP